MKNWQLWLIIFYVCLSRFASERFLMGMAMGAFLAVLIFGAARR